MAIRESTAYGRDFRNNASISLIGAFPSGHKLRLKTEKPPPQAACQVRIVGRSETVGECLSYVSVGPFIVDLQIHASRGKAFVPKRLLNRWQRHSLLNEI